MVTKKAGVHSIQAGAKEAAEGAAVRDRVRALSIAAFRDRKLSLSDVPKLVQEVLEGAVATVDKSIPASSRNVLREVFDGLSDGVKAIASAGSATVDDVRERGRAIKSKNVSVAAKRMLAADADFLGAVKKYAGKASKEVRQELEALVTRAERTGPKVTASVRKTAKAADGRLLELTGETARAGVRAVRRAAGALAMGAGGLLEGLAVAITPQGRPRTAKKSGVAAVPSAKKKTATKAARKKPPKKRAL
jgi:hypothetical protein